MTEQTIRPRPGSHIWRRTDGEDTAFKVQMSGAGYMTQFPGSTAEEVMHAEGRQPGGIFVSDFDENWTEVEDVLNRMAMVQNEEPAVILGPTKPTFGEWEELAEWTPKP